MLTHPANYVDQADYTDPYEIGIRIFLGAAIVDEEEDAAQREMNEVERVHAPPIELVRITLEQGIEIKNRGPESRIQNLKNNPRLIKKKK